MAYKMTIESPTTISQSNAGLSSSTYRTSAWFSSAYTFPTQPIYSFPLISRIQKSGIEIALPKQLFVDTKLVASGFEPWCTLGLPQNLNFVTVEDWSDFSARLKLGSEDDAPEFLLTQGSTTSFLTNGPVALTITCTNGVSLRTVGKRLIITKAEQPGWLIVEPEQGSSEASATPASTGTVRSQTGTYRIITVAAEQNPDTLSDDQLTWNTTIEKTLTRAQTDTTVQTTYATSNGQPTGMILWPHQFDSLTEPAEVVGTFPSAAGPLRLAYLSEYTTEQATPQLARDFATTATGQKKAEIQASIIKEAQTAITTPVPAGVYFKGTWIGALTTLLQLSELYELPDTSTQLATKLSAILEESSKDFVYDKELKLVRSLHPEFGNEKGNDHHFHYGYYLRGLSILADFQPLTPGQQELGQMLTEDIATADLTSTKFPALRTFDRAFGHSWADATSAFADGNNQESTSEALQAWYGVYLWAQTTQNTELQHLAQWLFAQELDSTQSYWFGQNNPFPAGYTHPIASLVWHGKREFNTWFSPQVGHIVGIQLLPITPVSGEIFSAIKSGEVIQASLVDDPNLWKHEWNDLLSATLSYTNKKEAQKISENVTGEAGLKLRSLYLHTIWSQPETPAQ